MEASMRENDRQSKNPSASTVRSATPITLTLQQRFRSTAADETDQAERWGKVLGELPSNPHHERACPHCRLLQDVSFLRGKAAGLFAAADVLDHFVRVTFGGRVLIKAALSMTAGVLHVA